MITLAYETIGGCNCTKDELLDENVYWKMTRRNGKITAVCVYKMTPNGRKMFLLASDGSEQGKTDIRKIMSEDVTQEERHFYAEVSGKPEYMYKKRGAKSIPTSDVEKILVGKDIQPTGEDEYRYTRQVGPDKKTFTKVMVGNPKME